METVAGNIFMRFSGNYEMLETGHEVEGHEHNFDHVTFFVAGEWECWQFEPVVNAQGERQMDAEGKPLMVQKAHRMKEAGSWLFIPAHCHHRFILRKGPGKYVCIYSHRHPEDGRVVEEDLGWLPGRS